MQLPLTPDVLIPLGVGALVVIVGVVVLTRGLRRRSDDAGTIAASDWTGEKVGVPESQPAMSGPVTVAEAVAVREADTAPLPVSTPVAAAEEFRPLADLFPDLLPAARDGSVPVARRAGESGSARRAPATLGHPGPPKDAAPRSAAAGDVPDPVAATSAGTGTDPAVVSRAARPAGSASAAGWPHGDDWPRPAPAAADPAAPTDPAAAGRPADPAGSDGPVPLPAAAPAPVRPAATGGPGVPPAAEVAAGEPDRSAGSSRPVAAAVAHVLAARAAVTDPARGDARDRLLAVLLDDPVRAVGAALDLADCQEQLRTLAGAVRDGRARVVRSLGRLAAAGLSPEQLARLSGLSDGEVRGYLAEGAAGDGLRRAPGPQAPPHEA